MDDKSEDFDINENYAFETEESAKKKFKELVEDFENNVDLEDFVIEKDDYNYCAYEEGYYDRNHFVVEIINTEIKK